MTICIRLAWTIRIVSLSSTGFYCVTAFCLFFLLNFERINKRMCEQSPGVKTFRKKTQAKVLRLASGLVHDKVQCSVKVYIRRGLMHSGHRTEGRMNVGTCRGDSLAALVAWLLRY